MVTKREAQKELFRANFGWPKDVTVAPHARRGSRGVRGHHRTLTSAQESWALYTNGLVDGWRLGTEQAVEGAIEGGDPGFVGIEQKEVEDYMDRQRALIHRLRRG